MEKIPKININDFDYDLPQERIARYPLQSREKSKLLIWKDSAIEEDRFFNISKYLPERSLLIFNNSRVIPARLYFEKATGAKIEIFCLEPFIPGEYEKALSASNECTWRCLVGNKKKWKSTPLISIFNLDNRDIALAAENVKDEGKTSIIKFSWSPNDVSFGEILNHTGVIPIPPYLQRATEEIDSTRYQTVYAHKNGSVAAPTAGLHFTESLIQELQRKKIKLQEITLHVSAGTFVPLTVDDITKHQMHEEIVIFNKHLINKMMDNLGNIMAVGTTSARSLESLYWMGVKIIINGLKEDKNLLIDQWDGFLLPQNIPLSDSLKAMLHFFLQNDTDSISFRTRLMIVPGYQFRVIEGIITNFHMPRSSLLLLIGAIAGNHWKTIYQYALDKDFRFLSYGDSSILFVKRMKDINRVF